MKSKLWQYLLIYIIVKYMSNRSKKLNCRLEEIYEKNYGVKKKQNYLWLDIVGKKDNIDVIIPQINILLYKIFKIYSKSI